MSGVHVHESNFFCVAIDAIGLMKIGAITMAVREEHSSENGAISLLRYHYKY